MAEGVIGAVAGAQLAVSRGSVGETDRVLGGELDGAASTIRVSSAGGKCEHQRAGHQRLRRARDGARLGGASCEVSAHYLYDDVVRLRTRRAPVGSLWVRAQMRRVVLLLDARDRGHKRRLVEVLALAQADVKHGALKRWGLHGDSGPDRDITATGCVSCTGRGAWE
jgi:hypothetical protein